MKGLESRENYIFKSLFLIFRLCLVPKKILRKKKIIKEIVFLCLVLLWKIQKNKIKSNIFI